MKPHPWAAIVGYYLVGLLAAAQLGKMSALVPMIAAELQMPLPTAAAAVSLVELGGATLGLVAGLLAARLGLRRTLLWGMAALAAGGVGLATAQGTLSLMGWRIVEAAGYLAVIVSAPVLIATTAARAPQPTAIGTAMALWSSFVPVGLALGAWAWAGAAGWVGWRGAMLAGAGLAAAAWLFYGLQRRGAAAAAAAAAGPDGAGPAPPPPGAGSGTLPSGGISAGTWYLVTSFGCYALFEIGLLGLLPSYLTARAGMTVAEAGSWTALASLATVLGSVGAAWWIRRGLGLRPLLWVSLLVPAALLPAVFVESPSGTTVAWIAVLLNAVSGLYPSLAFAQLPVVAGGARRMVRANGLFAQFGASGSLLGPPVTAWCVQHGGWPAAAWFGIAVSLPSLWLGLRAFGSTGRPTQAGD